MGLFKTKYLLVGINILLTATANNLSDPAELSYYCNMLWIMYMAVLLIFAICHPLFSREGMFLWNYTIYPEGKALFY